jgi:hypothetical protein
MLKKLDAKLGEQALYAPHMGKELHKWTMKRVEAVDGLARAEELWLAAHEALDAALKAE